MAKPAVKRKSDGALLTATNKRSKAPTARGDDSGSEQAEDESDGQLFVRQQPVAAKYIRKSTLTSRRSEPVKRAPRSDEYDEDEGRTDGQNFLALVEFEGMKKRKAARDASQYMENLKDRISRSEESLNSHLRDLRAEDARDRQDTSFIEAFQDAYAASRPAPPPRYDAKDMIRSKSFSFATLFYRSHDVVASAKRILESFESASENLSKIDTSGLMDNNWGEQNEQTAEILALGYKVGLGKYDAMLGGADEPVLEEEDSIFVDMIYKPTEKSPSLTWGGIVKKQEKLARKLVKALAVDVV
ncbi:hypothetical protein BUE80_DR007938 [Diplocarpon rosae]|nr:hypothetical protein BUE80_DR007938 [Diplocarpon rosae]